MGNLKVLNAKFLVCKAWFKEMSFQLQNASAVITNSIIYFPQQAQDETRLPASRSSSIGPEGRFSFFHPKVKVKETITLNQTQP